LLEGDTGLNDRNSKKYNSNTETLFINHTMQCIP